MSSYRTWLVIREAPNDELRILANTLRVWGRLDFTARPPAALTLRGDTAVLSTPNPRDFFEKALYAAQSNRPVRALSAAPAAALRRMDGRIFFASAMHVRITCAAATPGPQDDPYFRRLIELRFLASELQGNFDTRGTEVVDAGIPQGDPLFIDPVPLTLDDAALSLLLADDARTLASLNGFFLPPVRESAAPGTYFEEGLRRAREALAQRLGAATAGPSQPSGIHLWRVTDDACLRDVFLDGGSIDLVHGDGEPTTMAINMATAANGGVLAAYRGRVLLTPDRASGPRWSLSIAHALRSDVIDAVRSLPTLRAAQSAVAWDTAAPTRQFDAGGREHGSWQRLRDLTGQLDPRAAGDAIKVLQDRVLFPSRARPGAFADHDLAERELIRHLWRCPWSADSNAAWRMALLDFLKQEFIGAHPSIADRVNAWAADGQFECRQTPDRTEVTYPSASSPDDVLRWRLTAPIGTVFKPNACVRLDDGFSKLDRGYQLAS